MKKPVKTIEVAFIADEAFALPAGVAISSLVGTKAKSTKVVVHILASGLSDDSRKRIAALKTRDVKIDIRDIDGSEFAAITSANVHVSSAAIFKFKLPELFPALDKILYLDGDIVVRADLMELWETELGDNYVAAVEDHLAYRFGGKTLQERIGYPHEKYFNSGVMLANLKAWRTDDIGEKLMQYRLNGKNDFMDQDALNFILGARTVWLDTKYNTTSTNFRYQEVAVRAVAESAAVVYHYASSEKPWKIVGSDNEAAWLAQFERSPFADVKLERRPRTAMEELRRRGFQLSHKLRDKETLIDAQQVSISELKGALASVRRDRREILLTVEGHRERAAVLESANKELDAALQESKLKISELRGSLAAVRRDRQEALSAGESHKARVEALEGDNAKLTAALQENKQEISSLRGALEKVRRDRQEALSAGEAHKARAEALKGDNKGLNAALQEAKQEAASLRGSLETAERDRQEALSAGEAQKARAEALEGDNKGLNAALQEAKQEAASLRGSLETAERNRQDILAAGEAHKARAEVLEGDNKGLSEALKESRQKLSELRGAVATVKAHRENLKKRIAVLEAERDAQDSALQMRGAAIKRMEAEQTALIGERDGLKRELAAARKDCAHLGESMAAVRASVSFRLGRIITWAPRKLRGMLRRK